MRKLIAMAVALPMMLGLIAGPAAATDAPSPAAPPSILPGAVHGDGQWTYQDGHTEHHTADYGLIADIGNGSITVIRPDMVRVTVALPETTCVRIDGVPADLAGLHRGMRAVVFAQVADDGSSSVRVVRAGFPLIRWDQPSCGLLTDAVHGDVTITYRDGSTRTFSVDAGDIASVDGGEILMTRPDGSQVQTTIDGNTHIHGVSSLGDLVGHSAIVVSERIADSLIAKTVRARMSYA